MIRFSPILLLILIAFSCKREPVACVSVSDFTPLFGEKVTIDPSCSKKTKWVEFYMDGKKFNEGNAAVGYTCAGSPGQHTISVKAYPQYGSCGLCDVSSYSCTIEFSKKISATANSPAYDQNLKLTAYPENGLDFFWTGPNGYQGRGQEIDINHVTAAAAGTYSVYAVYGYQDTSETATVNVSLVPVTSPCSPANNQFTFTGGLPSATLNSIYSSALIDNYELYASAPSVYVSLSFKGNTPPADGVYTTAASTLDMAGNEVFMTVKPTGFLEDPVVETGAKVYVTVNAGKIMATFCGIGFTYNQYNFTITGKIVEP